jgi:ATP-binding cassette, subfamily C (CFTR/MRP), member 1
MAGLDEKDPKAPDPNTAIAAKELAIDDKEIDDDLAIEIEKEKAEDGEIQHGKGAVRSELKLTKSYATDTSAATGATAPSKPPEKQSWHRKLNPLRWGGIPPVPEERQVSREYTAGFLSLVTFQWMAPLMSVSLVAAVSVESIC